MKVITTICVPSDVYRFYAEEYEKKYTNSPEDLMVIYLSRHAHRIMRQRLKESDSSPDAPETPSHPDPDRDIPFPNPALFF